MIRPLAIRWKLKTKAPEKLLTALIASGIPFSSPRREEYGLSFLSGLMSKKRLTAWCKRNGFGFETEYEGLIVPLFALKRRPGIIFGIILSLFFIHLSTFYIWSVRIEGNKDIPDSEIIRLLGECGFGEGTKKSTADTEEIESIMLRKCHGISFISLNVHGMVAEVIVHERTTADRALDGSIPYNLVADCDGVIVSSLILEGNALFETGDTVYKGQLLVSGLIDDAVGGTRTARAKGKVWARTHRTLTFEIPLKETVKEYTHTKTVMGVRVLGHSFYKPIDDPCPNYETELLDEPIHLLGLELPLTRETRHINYYELSAVTLTEDEARERALAEYGSYISTELEGATLTDEAFSFETKEDRLIMTAEVSAIENIAAEKKIEITE